MKTKNTNKQPHITMKTKQKAFPYVAVPFDRISRDIGFLIKVIPRLRKAAMIPKSHREPLVLFIKAA